MSPLPLQRNLYCTVILEGKFGETMIKENNSIRIEADDPLVLIQTDKKIYKPGQKGTVTDIAWRIFSRKVSRFPK